MRSVTANMKSHLAGGVTTLAMCWKIERTDGVVKGFTDHDKDIPYEGVTYQSLYSGTVTSLENTSKMNAGNLEIEMLLSSSGISELDLRAGLYNHAKVWVFLINYKDTSMGIIKYLYGRLGEVTIKDGVARSEFFGLGSYLEESYGRIYTIDCDPNVVLGDSRCKYSLGSPATGAATSVTDRRTLYDTSRTEADNWFAYGKITFTSGANSGLSMEVREYVLSSGKIVLDLPMPYNILVGDTYEIVVGCDHKFSTCKTKFNNVINFQGFPHIPGMDKYLDYPNSHG